MRNRNLISGVIGVVFGSLWTLNGLLSGAASRAGDSPYAAGKFAALIFGFAFLAAGIYYLRKGFRERSR